MGIGHPSIIRSSLLIYFERGPLEFRTGFRQSGCRPWAISPQLPRLDRSWMEKRRILIVDNNDELRALLEEGLGKLGHEVVVTGEREKALARTDLDEFDLIISDLSEAEVNGHPIGDLQRKHLVTPITPKSTEPGIIKAFKMGAANYLRLPYNAEALREIVEQTLSHKLRYLDDPTVLPHVHEKIEFELPSDLSLMDGVLEYLQERVAKLGLIKQERLISSSPSTKRSSTPSNTEIRATRTSC
jgi:CheY-like chemotaxis protein